MVHIDKTIFKTFMAKIMKDLIQFSSYLSSQYAIFKSYSYGWVMDTASKITKDLVFIHGQTAPLEPCWPPQD